VRTAFRAAAVAAISFGLLAAAFTGVVGAAHTKSGRFLLPYLAELPGMGGLCPLGFADDLSAARRDALRHDILVKDAGTLAAASRPALGFALGRTSRDEVGQWATAYHIECTRKREDLRCVGVPAEAIGPASGTWAVLFKFDAESHLVAVDATSDATDVTAAVAVYEGASDAVTREAGPPTRTSGTPDAAWLGKGTLNQANAEYRFSDYRAQVTATNMGQRGVVVHETFQAI
jgi:hypothetical protein